MTTILRGASIAGAVALLVAAALTPGTLDSSGFPATPAAFVFSAAAALALLAVGLGRRWQQTAIWLALLIVGAAAHLQLVTAGPRVAYQHLALLELGGIWSFIMIAVLVAQISIVVASLKHLKASAVGLLER
ncbi:MAG: hypothetical protein ABL963_15945, partial [Longimicrobiales bacterium]